MTAKTNGQQFAALMREIFRIGTRTRASREAFGKKRRVELITAFDRDDLTTDVLTYVRDAIYSPPDHPADEMALIRAAWGAVCAWEKHIETGRAGASQCRYLKCLSPWQFTKLLGEMVDAGVTNTGEGERWFRARRDADLAAYQANPRY